MQNRGTVEDLHNYILLEKKIPMNLKCHVQSCLHTRILTNESVHRSSVIIFINMFSQNMYRVSIKLHVYKHELVEVWENEKCCGNTSRR